MMSYTQASESWMRDEKVISEVEDRLIYTCWDGIAGMRKRRR